MEKVEDKNTQRVDICILSPGPLEVPTNRGGGIEEQHYRVGLELAKRFYVIMVAPFYRNYRRQVVVNDRFMVEEVHFRSLRKYPPETAIERYMAVILAPLYSILVSLKMLRLAKKGTRIVMVTDLLTGLLPAILARLLGRKVIFSEGNLSPWISPYVARKKLSADEKIMHFSTILMGRLVSKLSYFIRVQSRLIARGMIEDGLDASKMVIIGPGIDISLFIPASSKGYSLENLRIGFVGRLTDEKGSPLLLEVCKTAERICPKIKFVIAGDGPYADQFRHLTNVEHVGWVPRNRLAQFLLQTQAVLFFQRDLGIAELEAMALGKVLIACKIGDTPQTIKHLRNGMLCTPDAQSYVRAIRLLANKPHIIRTMSKGARKTAEKYFDWNIVGRKWVLLCARCFNGKV